MPWLKVQAAGFQHRRVVAEVGIAAPDVERPAGFEHASDLTEPGVQHLVERIFRNEVVGQRPVLGPHLLAGLGRVGDAASHVERLVVHLLRQVRVRAKAGGDGVLERGSTLTL
ncbi:MAG: hypothetical protein KatS3mg105_0603 [Gemmatales bacterium]|nr:MAG: hypothetical protein KatS3mg105_0603 [Gemmatales bacterium]